MWNSGFTCTAKEKIPLVADFITVYTWSVGLHVPGNIPFTFTEFYVVCTALSNVPLWIWKKNNFALSSAWRELIYFWGRGGSKIRPNFVISNVCANAPVTYRLWRPSLIPNKQWIKNKNRKKNRNHGWLICGQIQVDQVAYNCQWRAFFVLFIHQCKTALKADRKSFF